MGGRLAWTIETWGAHGDVTLDVILHWCESYAAEYVEETEQCFGCFEKFSRVDCVVLALVDGHVNEGAFAGEVEEGSAWRDCSSHCGI